MLRIEIRHPGGKAPVVIDLKEKHFVASSAAETEVEVGGYFVRVTAQPSSVDAESLIPVEHRERWIDWIWVVAGLAFVMGQALFFDTFMDPTSKVWVQMVITQLAILVGALSGAGVLSLIHRALHGNFRFLHSLRLTVEILLILCVLFTEFFQLRWIIGGPLAIREVYDAVIYLGGALILWRLGKFFLPAVKPWIRFAAVALLYGSGSFLMFSHLIPMKNKVRPRAIVMAPILPDALEAAPVTPEEYLERLGGVFE